MSRVVTDDEVEQLFAFVRSKYVKWVDIQHEIVDHLASNIEHLWMEDSNLSFEIALQQTYSKFPITGFSDWVASKEKEIGRFWYRKFGGYLRKFFGLPKILITIGLSLIFYQIMSAFGESSVVVILTMVFACVIGGQIYRYKTYTKRLSKELRKSLVTKTFQDINMLTLILMINLPTYLNALNNYSATTLAIISFLLSFFVIWEYAWIFVFPGMLQEELDRKYKFLNLQVV